MSELWTRWQGHLINGVYPLGRYLGSSDHSGVFLTRSPARGAAEIAIKLVPTDRALAESLLPRWKRAGGLSHPNLLHLYEWGGCQLEGSPYLYAVMDYADQTLAQLLQSRALTEVEAREMLVPVLDALAFLHERGLVQGQLKPANILVRGDQIKLASDTVRRFGDRGPAAHGQTRHDPPEAPDGSGSPAGDIWALGITLCEALTRRSPSISSEYGDSVALPADFAPAFHDLVARSLSRRPQDRPRLSELVAWATGRPERSVRAAEPNAADPVPAEPKSAAATSVEPASIESATIEPTSAESYATAPATAKAGRAPVTPRMVSADGLQAADIGAEADTPRVPFAVIAGAVLSVALIWGGWHLFRKHPVSAAPALAALSTAPSTSTTGASARPAANNNPEAGPTLAATAPHESTATAPPRALNEVIPDVPLSARRTIRGHIKVWVRVLLDDHGSVVGTIADRAGPSRYFQRLAQQAAKKWAFSSTGNSSRHVMQIRFDFSRDGTQARAVPIR